MRVFHAEAIPHAVEPASATTDKGHMLTGLLRLVFQQPIDCNVLKDVPLFLVLAEYSLLAHPELEQNPPRCRVANKVLSVNSVQSEHLETVGHERSG